LKVLSSLVQIQLFAV